MGADVYDNPNLQTGDLLWQDGAFENFVHPAAIVWKPDPPSAGAVADLISSPHIGGMPSLFGSGEVKNVRYDLPSIAYAAAWSWNGGIVGPVRADGSGCYIPETDGYSY
jgi:hypothetical protein